MTNVNLVRRWKPVLKKAHIHPDMEAEVAIKLEVAFKKWALGDSDGSSKWQKDLQAIIKPYDRRKNTIR